MSEFLSVLSSMTMVALVVIYIKQVIKGVSTPNPVTWVIWFVVMAMNTITYYFVTQNVWPILTPLVITCGMLIVLVYSSVKGKFGRIGTIEIVILSLAVLIGIFWKTTRDPVFSNLLMQIVLLISFIPTIAGLIKGKLKERPLPWDLAVLSYCFLIASVVVNSDWNWIKLAYPIINGIIGNGSIAIIAHLRKN